MSKIISLNFIHKNNKCLNPNKYPIIYFWDGINNIFDSMLGDIEFTNFLINNFCTIENYTNINIYMNEFEIENESYSQEILELQSIFPLTNKFLESLSYVYIETILLDLYRISIKEEYKLLVESNIDNIINIYYILKDKYKERINSETLNKYILSQLQQKYNLNKDNCDEILKIYKGIIE